MFENLQEKLESAFKTLKGQGQITELNVAATMKEIRRALVDADVNYKIAKEFTDKVRDEALGQKVLIAVQPGQLLVKIMSDELTKLMGSTVSDITISGNPAVILISGLQGSGKTTFSSKLAWYLKNNRKKDSLLIAGDVYRPAAIEQLKIMGQKVNTEVYSEPENKNPVQIALNGIEYAKQKNIPVVIIDTAGRLAIDEQMMNEIAAVKQATNPCETLFVVDSMTGQDAVNTAKAFNDRLNFDGIVLTKLDGDTRGGAALSIKYVVDKSIKFISYGEKPESIDQFYPDRMAQRILGMGDIISFVEKAQMQFDEREAAKLESKIKKNQFDFNDFIDQIGMIKKMGNIKDLLTMIPGMSQALRGVDLDDSAFKKVECIIQSMTPYERANPDIIDASRRKRISAGSGTSTEAMDRFMKQFAEMREVMRKMMSTQAAAGNRGFKMPNPFGRR